MEDEVDRLVSGWRRVLPDVDISPLEVLSRVTRLARHLDRQRTVVFARHDLETWSFDVLSALRRSVRVQLTAAGARRVDGALLDLVARENAILGTLDDDERRALADLLRRIVAPFDA